MAYVGSSSSWASKRVDSIDDAVTLNKKDSGKVFMVTHTGGSESSSGGYTITLPTPANAGIGWSAKFMVNCAAGSTLSNEASEDVILNDGQTDVMVVNFIDAADAGAVSLVHDSQADTVGFDHTAVKGDWIEMFSDGSVWHAFGVSGADGGILVAS